MRDVVLALDQGTTGTTVLAVDRQLNIIARANQEFRQIYPQPGWVEHDLEDIWASTTQAMGAVLTQIDASRVAAIGITNQRETVGLWRRGDSRPIHNAIVWQCRRTADRCETLRKQGLEARYRDRCGLLLDPYFSGTKLGWLLDNVPDARALADAGELAAGTIDTFLVWRLTQGAAHVTDVSNASRTLLFDIRTRRFEDDLLTPLGVPRAVLPQIRSSAEVYGHTKGVPGLDDGIPVAGMAGDQQAALFGQACFDVGDTKCTYGTGAFILKNIGSEPRPSGHNMLTTVAWQLGPDAPMTYALEGAVFIAGAAVQWLRDGLQILQSASDIERLAAEVDDSGDVVFVPALTGLGAPHWRPEARGLIRGITRGTTRAHLARATLEGIALSVQEVMTAMIADSGPITELRVDGGAAANDLLMQIQSNLAGQAVVRPEVLETTAAGAAFLAGIGAQVFDSTDAIRAVWRENKRFEPTDTDGAARLKSRWAEAIAHA